MTENTKELKNEYQIRFGHMAEYRRRVWKILVGRFFQPLIGDSKVILDLGSGWGEFINEISASRRYAMDLNDDSSLKTAHDIEFLHQDCSHHWSLEDASLDIVFTSNFFEHLRTKPDLDATLREAYRCLKPGGRIICLGPNIKYVGHSYWDFYDHYIALSHLSLAEALRLRSFEIPTVIPRFLPYTMADGTRPPLIFLKVYLRMPWIWPLVGKQFLIIGQKPEL